MTAINGEKIQWKKFYQLISGIHYDSPIAVVEEKLLEVSKELQNGILGYNKNNPVSNEKLEKQMKQDGQEKIIPFTQKLSSFLDLDSTQSWELLRYYLVNEYRGSAGSLSNYISSESSMIKLLSDIWYYYSLERTVMLKCVKHILEFYPSDKNPYSGAYQKVLDKIGMKNLRKSYIDQFESLVKEVLPIKPLQLDLFNNQQKMQAWSERKCREMIEILQIILLTSHYDQMSLEELKKLIELFKLHSFGKQQQHLIPGNDFHDDLIRKIVYCEISIFLVVLNAKNFEDHNLMSDIRKSLDSHLVTFHQYPEHGPILLVWMLFNFSDNAENFSVEQTSRFHQIGSRAIQLNVFEFLQKLLCHKIFKDKSVYSRIVRKSVYDHLSLLCELFDADGSIAQHPKVFELMSEVLSTPSIALEFVKNEDAPLHSLFDSAKEMFPSDFLPLSMIAKSLSIASATGNKYIREQLENLPICTEVYNGDKYDIRQAENDEFVLLNDYTPFPRVDFVIQKGTRVVIMDKNETFIHFRTKLNYFDALHHEIIDLLEKIQTRPEEICAGSIERIEWGIKVLGAIVKRIQDPENEISDQMIHPTEMVFDILGKLKGVERPPLELFAGCLEVCAGLLQFPIYNDEIFRRIINLNILPTVHNAQLDSVNYANGVSFESSLVGYYLVNIEKNSGKYSFLKAYLHFLKTFTEIAVNKEELSTASVYSVELPGLIFLLREIFPYAHSWHFENEQDKYDILIFILQYIFLILQYSNNQSKNSAARILLRDISVFSLLNLENGVTLLKFVGVGNPALYSFMENDSNWILAANSNLNLLVQLSMTILMMILRLKKVVFPENEGMELSPIEKLIYTQPKQRDTLRIIPIVTNYTSYVFNNRLPLLSCRLLKRFAIEFQRSLLACLDMEPDQIRLTFLQRLKDELESNDLKIAILEFVDSCIHNQPGLTEAFFKVSYQNEKRFLIKPVKSQHSIGEGIVVYMEEYLEAIASDPSKIMNPQLSRIMSLFHSLWKNNMQNLVKDLLQKPTFWSSLCNPLLNVQKNTKIKAYSQLFNILGIELFKLNKNSETDMDENLKKVLDKFLSPQQFGKWIDYVFEFPEPEEVLRIGDETPEWLNSLQSFKDFNVLLIRKKEFIHVKEETKKILIEKCMEALVKRSRVTEDLRPFVVLSEMFLILLNDYDINLNSEEENLKLLKQIGELLNMITNYLDSLHPRGKDSILAIGIKVIDMEANLIVKNREITEGFLYSIVEILGQELFKLENQVKSGKTAENGKNFTILLAINLVKKILLVYETKQQSTVGWEFCFNNAKIFNRLLSLVSQISQIHSKREITAELLDLLVFLAKGEFSKELLYCDIGFYLWLKLLPPKELLDRPYVQVNEAKDKWQSQEWWVIYMKGIELVTVLLEKHKHLFFKDAMFFVGIHEEFLLDALLLAKQSLESNAIKLIKITLNFVCELVNYEKEWRMEHSQSMINVVRCVQILMNQSVSLLYRPKILKRFTEVSPVPLEEAMEPLQNEITEDLVTAMNELIEIVSLCTACLLKFSPNLLNLLCDIEFQPTKYIPLVEISFGAPKINSETVPQLSFGVVLSAVCMLCKSLNLQQYTFSQIPLNTLPQEQDQQDWDDSTFSHSVTDSTSPQKSFSLVPPSSTASSSSSPRRQFAKSLSMTSMNSSIVALPPSNELLTHLDGKTCLVALEFVLTLLASQSLLALKDMHLSGREKQLIKRELSTELHVFHDFVKKRILKDSSKSILHRKKLGIYKITNEIDSDDENAGSPSPKPPAPPRRSIDLSKSMRVNVMKKQHYQQIQQKQSSAPFDISSISPIHPSSQSRIQEQTPLRGILKPSASTSIKRVGFNLNEDENDGGKIVISECEEDEPILLDPVDPTFTGLSFVKLVEEDYLHFLSNLFLVICNTEN